VSACTVKLEVFEGPLDLLLHLIKKSEVAVADIPIATITDQYLAMLEAEPDFANLDGAGEYLVMAATLAYLKSRTLLPAADEAEDETDGEDPREALVRQLLEYQRFREAAVALGDRNVLTRDVFAPPGEPCPGPAAGEPEPPPVRDVCLADLLDALRDVLGRRQPPRPHEVYRPGTSIVESVRRILARFALDESVAFGDLFAADTSRGDVVVTFLALLELMRLEVVRAAQEERFGPILLRLAVPDLETAATRVQDLAHVEAEWGGGEEEPDGHGLVRPAE
jgi:segregation and condensation protein A